MPWGQELEILPSHGVVHQVLLAAGFVRGVTLSTKKAIHRWAGVILGKSHPLIFLPIDDSRWNEPIIPSLGWNVCLFTQFSITKIYTSTRFNCLALGWKKSVKREKRTFASHFSWPKKQQLEGGMSVQSIIRILRPEMHPERQILAHVFLKILIKPKKK